MLACGAFLVFSVGANRRNPWKDADRLKLAEIVAGGPGRMWRVITVHMLRPSVKAMEAVADKFEQARGKFLRLVVSDAEKEFSGPMRTGFGQDCTEDEAEVDFAEVRGEFETNKFVVEMKNELAALAERVAKFKQMLAN